MIGVKAVIAGGVLMIVGGQAEAASLRDCWSVADPAARAACYDQVTGRPDAAPASPPALPPATTYAPPATPAPAPQPSFGRSSVPPAAPQQAASGDGQRSDYNSSITAVTPLRHGYFRLTLADGSEYNTTIVGFPPPVGTEVHVRRTFLGTTYFDIAGRAGPIAVRRSRAR